MPRHVLKVALATLLSTGTLLLGPATLVRADAVDPCPPGFQPSHSGCHFGPSEDDLFLCSGCSCVFIGFGSLAALLVFLRKKRESGPREGGSPGG
ncbi:MAG: hypothetical protein K1X94_26240 [Sandaracinaceae bacterium]|nr:hypothetical protein [Sandaracinaceae bacterium]